MFEHIVLGMLEILKDSKCYKIYRYIGLITQSCPDNIHQTTSIA